MLELRDYQVEALEALRAGIRAGHQRQILCAPTGSGKTIVAAEMIRSAVEMGKRVAFIADRTALVRQTSERLWEVGITHGVLQSKNTFGRGEQVLVCSAQTLERRGYMPRADMVIVDEAHTQRKQSIKMVVDLDVPAIGLTATPFSVGLGKIYSNIVNARCTDELFEDGWLTRPRVFCATEIDMSGAKVNSMGEWGDSEVEKRAIPIVGDIVSEWVAHTHKIFGGPVKTLLFTPTIAMGRELCEAFNRAGYKFEQVGAGLDNRARHIDDFRCGRIDGLASCEALAKGFDVPDALCLISARPYRKSLTGHIQQIGRILRPSPGKKFGLILDHSGNYLRHVAATEAFWAEGWSVLDDGVKKEKSAVSEVKEQVERKCFECGMVMGGKEYICSNCGTKRERRKPNKVEVVAGDMREYKSLRSEVGDLWPHVCRLAVDRHPGDSSRAAAFAKVQFKTLTGGWPKWGREIAPVAECDVRVELAVAEAVARWKRSNHIRF